MIKGADLTLYTKEFDTIELHLSPLQLKAIIQILGISFQNENSYSCYSDESIRKLFEYNGNPLNLIPKKDYIK